MTTATISLIIVAMLSLYFFIATNVYELGSYAVGLFGFIMIFLQGILTQYDS